MYSWMLFFVLCSCDICDIWYDIWYDIYDMIWYDMIYDIWYDMIWYIIWYVIYDIRYDMIWYIFNCNWIDTRWQQYSTHLQNRHYIEQHNRQKQNIEQHSSLIRKSADRAPSLRGIPWHLSYNWGKITYSQSGCMSLC
jgi:hypothetical protein